MMSLSGCFLRGNDRNKAFLDVTLHANTLPAAQSPRTAIRFRQGSLVIHPRPAAWDAVSACTPDCAAGHGGSSIARLVYQDHDIAKDFYLSGTTIKLCAVVGGDVGTVAVEGYSVAHGNWDGI